MQGCTRSRDGQGIGEGLRSSALALAITLTGILSLSTTLLVAAPARANPDAIGAVDVIPAPATANPGRIERRTPDAQAVPVPGSVSPVSLPQQDPLGYVRARDGLARDGGPAAQPDDDPLARALGDFTSGLVAQMAGEDAPPDAGPQPLPLHEPLLARAEADLPMQDGQGGGGEEDPLDGDVFGEFFEGDDLGGSPPSGGILGDDGGGGSEDIGDGLRRHGSKRHLGRAATPGGHLGRLYGGVRPDLGIPAEGGGQKKGRSPTDDEVKVWYLVDVVQETGGWAQVEYIGSSYHVYLWWSSKDADEGYSANEHYFVNQDGKVYGNKFRTPDGTDDGTDGRTPLSMDERRKIEEGVLTGAASDPGEGPAVWGGGANPIDPIDRTAAADGDALGSGAAPDPNAQARVGTVQEVREQGAAGGETPWAGLIGPGDAALPGGGAGGDGVRSNINGFHVVDPVGEAATH